MTGRLSSPRVRWLLVLGAIAALALSVRLANVLVWYPSCDADILAKVEQGTPYAECSPDQYRIWGDSGYYYLQGYLLSRGHLYADGATWFTSNGARIVPSAGDPPLFSAWMGVLFQFGVRGSQAHRIATSLAGAVGIAGIAHVTARLAGRRAGVVAGLLGATAPMLFINDGMLLSESVYVPIVAVVLIAAFRFWEAPSVRRAALLGGAIGLAALTRGEALLLFGVLVLPLLWRRRERGWRELARWAGACWLTGGLLIAPWVVFNLTRFREPVFMTSQTGAVLSAGTCDVAWYGEALGYYGADCYSDYIAKGYPVGDPRLPGCDAAAAAAALGPDPAAKATQGRACWPDPERYDESERDKIISSFAWRYIREHQRRLPVVMVARVGRMFDLYNPGFGSEQERLGENVRLNWAVEGRGKWQSEVGFVEYVLLFPFAVAGVVVLRRRRALLSPVLALPAVITVTAALAFGVTRYRVPVDMAEVILAAVAIDAVLRRWWPVAAEADGTVPPVPRRETTTLPADD